MSVLLNIAEGAGRRSPNDKKNFYAIARGSATECAAALDALRHRRMIHDDVYQDARTLLLRIVAMLARLT